MLKGMFKWLNPFKSTHSNGLRSAVMVFRRYNVSDLTLRSMQRTKWNSYTNNAEFWMQLAEDMLQVHQSSGEWPLSLLDRLNPHPVTGDEWLELQDLDVERFQATMVKFSEYVEAVINDLSTIDQQERLAGRLNPMLEDVFGYRLIFKEAGYGIDTQ